MSQLDRSLSPARAIVALSEDGLAVLDCGHVRGRAKPVPDGERTLPCDACNADCNDSLALAGLERGQGLAGGPR